MIACHEEIADQLLLPRGCVDRVEEELADAGFGIRLHDDRADGDAISVAFAGTLTLPQQAAVDAFAAHTWLGRACDLPETSGHIKLEKPA